MTHWVFILAAILAVVTIIVFADILITILTMFIFKGAFYAKVDSNRINNIQKLADTNKDDKLADLGSGDGRIVIEFAQKGIQSAGFEINPWLVILSRYKISKLNLQDKAKILFKSFWKSDLAQYDIIVVYGVSYMMKDLEEKILKEAKKGAKVVSVYFKFPNLKSVKNEGDVFLYHV